MSNELTELQESRALMLLKATRDILNECNDSAYVQNVMEVSAIWDEVECDGNCLLEEITDLLDEIK